MGPEVTMDWPTANETYLEWTQNDPVKIFGTCAAMSMNWIMKALRTKRKLVLDFDNDMKLAIAAQYRKVNWDNDKGVMDWMTSYLTILNMRSSNQKTGNGTDIDPTTDYGTYALVFSGTVRSLVNGKSVPITVSHVVAFRRDEHESSYYDPNYGQFSVVTSRMSNFKNFVNSEIEKYGWSNVTWYYDRYELTS